jgi:hypothetical protein
MANKTVNARLVSVDFFRSLLLLSIRFDDDDDEQASTSHRSIFASPVNAAFFGSLRCAFVGNALMRSFVCVCCFSGDSMSSSQFNTPIHRQQVSKIDLRSTDMQRNIVQIRITTTTTTTTMMVVVAAMLSCVPIRLR